MGIKSAKRKSESNGANLGFEAKLWFTADKLRNNTDAAKYKHFVLGLIFLHDILLYEDFLTQFASAERKNGARFYTPRCLVRVLVEMLAPYKGQVYDPRLGRHVRAERKVWRRTWRAQTFDDILFLQPYRK